ncbi:recombinase family protein [Halomonas sp. HL-93]|uniref:recombinase family protein n=1 Tax=Halomonas sp. HL-93 TaxID=1666906 RepID=UPI0007F08E4C|nr:recombinase family protein [Halomonas sp. HL-93]SBR45153.1 Site-specific DNA recombinase [Halomonas sp. HL-93]
MKAIAYVRYSSAVQGDGDSVERQISPLEAFERRFNVKVEEIFKDEGVSSYSGDNIKKGRFSEILEKIENEEIKKGDFLVIESIDRISRQELNKTAKILQDILEKGIKIYTTIDERLYNYEDKERDLENYLMIGLIAKRSNDESETKSRRRKSAWDKAKQLAEDEGKIFSTSINTPYGLEIVDGKFKIIEEEAKEIRFIIENLKYEGVSATIRKLNEWSKRSWKPHHIGHFFHNQYIRGVYRAQKRENKKKVHERYIENYYPPIVSETAFYEAREAMKKRETKKEYGNKAKGHLNIFKNCIKCKECGSTMIFMKNKNPRGVWYSYYSCETKKEKRAGCEDQSLRAEYVIALFLAELEIRLQFKDDVDEKDKLIYEIMRTEEKQEDKKLFNDKNNELQKKKAILKNLENTAEELAENAPTYIFKKMSIIEKEVEKLKDELNKIEIKKIESLNIYSFDELKELVYTEKGRLKLNKFLKDRNIKVFVEYRRKERTVEQSIYIDNERYSVKARKFDLRNDTLLEKYEMKNLAEYI